MAFPTVEILGKKVILLSGYERFPQIASSKIKLGAIKIAALSDLRQSANENPDAVAFGYTAGKWVAAA